MDSTEPQGLEHRLDALEKHLERVHTLLVGLTEKIDHQRLDTAKATESLQQWVTDYVSLRLQQLVPETCEHVPHTDLSGGPYLPGTHIPCTDDVVHRVERIPIPFVRQMVVQKVAQQAQESGVTRVDVPFFESAATF